MTTQPARTMDPKGPWQHHTPRGRRRPHQRPGQRALRTQPAGPLRRPQLYVELCKRPVSCRPTYRSRHNCGTDATMYSSSEGWVTPRHLDRHVRRGGAQGGRHGAYTWRAEDWHSKARTPEPVSPGTNQRCPPKARQLQKLQEYERHLQDQSTSQPACATISNDLKSNERTVLVDR